MAWRFGTKASVATTLSMHRRIYICFWFNSPSSELNVCHVADNIFQSTFLNEYGLILIEVSWKLVLKGPMDK